MIHPIPNWAEYIIKNGSFIFVFKSEPKYLIWDTSAENTRNMRGKKRCRIKIEIDPIKTIKLERKLPDIIWSNPLDPGNFISSSNRVPRYINSHLEIVTKEGEIYKEVALMQILFKE